MSVMCVCMHDMYVYCVCIIRMYVRYAMARYVCALGYVRALGVYVVYLCALDKCCALAMYVDSICMYDMHVCIVCMLCMLSNMYVCMQVV